MSASSSGSRLPVMASPVAPGELAPRTARTAGTVQGVILITVPLFSMMGAMLMAPLLPTMQASFPEAPYARVLVPLLLTAPALLLALLAPVAGLVANRFGTRRLLLVSLSLYGIAGTAPIYLRSLETILASRLLVGVAEAGLATSAVTLVSAYFSGDARQKWYAYQVMLLPWIGAVLIAITGWIGDVSWRMTFGLYAISLLWVLLAKVFLFEPPRLAEAGRGRLPPLRHLLLVAAIQMPGSLFFYVSAVEVAFLLKEHGAAAPSTAANVTALGLLIGPLGALLSRKLTHIRVGTLIAVAMALMGAGLAVMALGRDVPVIAIGLVVQQIGGGLLLPTAVTFVLGLAGPRDRSAYAGVWYSCQMVGQFLTPLVMSALMWMTGERARSVLTAAALAASTCAWLLSSGALRRPVVAPETRIPGP
jgi:MFS family permease